MDKLFDKYAWQARTLPALIVLSPIALAALAWEPKVEDAVKPAMGVLGSAGVLVLLSHFARTAGKRAEETLYGESGAPPSTTLLRHRDTTLDPVTKRRYHERLSRLIPESRIPTPEEEAADPAAADHVYASCGRVLRARTRDEKKFSLLFSENMSYGFRRNLHGLRPVAIMVSLAGVGGCVWKLVQDHRAHLPLSPLTVACLLGCLGLAAAWIFFINGGWVREAANDYAQRLLESIDQLEPPAK